MATSPSKNWALRESLAIAVVTVVGSVLRIWPLGRLGLNHFDEGIYAMAASWSLLQKGLAALDPSLIPYSPPGYPILGGVAYWLLGRSDGAMIAVSQMAGTLTIPVVAWLARRAFGGGAGFAAATVCAFSGPHIAFSRMALTDASFLLAWLLAMGAGMRFLERPDALRSLLMGLSVGFAQQFKYNGWLAGAIVIGSAVVGILVRPEDRKAASIFKTFGWGGVAAVIASMVVWPWYAFVEAHGGYSALLRHQQKYLGGLRDWWPNFLTQCDQSVALVGVGCWTVFAALVVATPSPWIAHAGGAEDGEMPRPRRDGFRFIWLCLPWGCSFAFAIAPYWLGLILAPWVLSSPRPAIRTIGVGWLVLTVISPFYHPYARLWLPYHAINWLLMGSLLARGFGVIPAARPGSSWSKVGRGRLRGLTLRSLLLTGLIGLGLFALLSTLMRHARPQPGLLAPSDSLYRATLHIAEKLPREVQSLRLLARPPVTYYLAARIPLSSMPGSEAMLKGGDPQAWALVDSAILRSESGEILGGRGHDGLDRFKNNWEIVEEFPTNPSLPTLLDLDPGLARSDSGDRSYPLWLLRPRTSKAPR